MQIQKRLTFEFALVRFSLVFILTVNIYINREFVIRFKPKANVNCK